MFTKVWSLRTTESRGKEKILINDPHFFASDKIKEDKEAARVINDRYLQISGFGPRKQ